MHEIDKIYSAYKLKDINRKGKVRTRHESTAEHTFSSLILAEYFFKKEKNLDKETARKIILYHDICEIYAGDIFRPNEKEQKEKEQKENNAVKKISREFPKELKKDFIYAWKEWSERKTKEAKFAKAIDALDPLIQAINQPEEWKKYNFNEKMLRESKEKYFKEFPAMLKFFNKLIKELLKRKVLPKK